jgi:hypothetical protein
LSYLPGFVTRHNLARYKIASALFSVVAIALVKEKREERRRDLGLGLAGQNWTASSQQGADTRNSKAKSVCSRSYSSIILTMYEEGKRNVADVNGDAAR